ncbi:Maf-like protein YceF [Marinomonas spartinae]|uniref:7-methyl-GTP pyrophosphatase n=1 Tax=Marinomonas spartinae TaxID=1792290 RepID=A0A1A8TKC9_9GAMM|nr:nucleoside triphosphate pyrophosphatase [Marinomonas spartinae]SBS34304.1 Maf-like protein YceF [Marinomonas spartinae]SBS37563.1 Maf-like protein YceF [Marinomonas spartinae]
MTKKLILGSSSPYRQALLERLNLAFQCHSPDIDESPKEHEMPEQLVKRLTIQKAQAVCQDLNRHDLLIISSDQVAVLDGHILGKPHTIENATAQLLRFSGRKVTFLTGLCVLDSETMTHSYTLNEYHVYFRELNREEVARYVCIEQPLDCAGSFKCEGLGVALFEKMAGDDPTSLIGLPLITLCKMLRQYDVSPFS